jgi:ribosome maturation factor RimP
MTGRTKAVGASPLFYCILAGLHTIPAVGFTMKRTDVISQIEQIVAPVAQAAGLEIVEIELKGSGRHQMLLIVIDKPGGVTHGDCEIITREAGELIDAADPISGTYQLEVSSPGVERPLRKWQDWERFVGQKVKVVLKQPVSASASSEEPEPPALPPEASGATGSSSKKSKSKSAASKSAASVPSGLKHFDGVVRRAEDQSLTVELSGGEQVTFPFDQVSRANLKFEW